MKSILFLVFLSASSISWSQADSIRTAELRATIDQLFAGMRSGDSTLVRDVFHEDAKAYTTFKKDNAFHLYEGLIDDFVEAVGTPHDEVWDERISNIVIKIDDGLAQVWMDYSFYLCDEFSHTGVNCMLLVNVDDRWQIINLADTRRKN